MWDSRGETGFLEGEKSLGTNMVLIKEAIAAVRAWWALLQWGVCGFIPVVSLVMTVVWNVYVPS